MPHSVTTQLLENNQRYGKGEALHDSAFPGLLPIPPAKRVAVLACMDARLDPADMLGLKVGEAHIMRNAGGVISDDMMRCLIISHHLLNTREVIVIQHTRCGMLAFTDELLRTGLEGDSDAAAAISHATGRYFMSPACCAASPASFLVPRGAPEALDAPRDANNIERLGWSVRRTMGAILSHPWLPVSGDDAITVRGFIYDVDTGLLEEVSYPGATGSFA